MAEDRTDPQPPSQTPLDHELTDHEAPDHALTGMETFFDNLFNQHMVLPQPPEGLEPVDDVEHSEGLKDEGIGPTGGAG